MKITVYPEANTKVFSVSLPVLAQVLFISKFSIKKKLGQAVAVAQLVEYLRNAHKAVGWLLSLTLTWHGSACF